MFDRSLLVAWANNRFVLVAPLLLTLSVSAISACGGESKRNSNSGPVIVDDAWARAADSGSTGVVYLTLHNIDSVAVSIASLTTPVAVAAELHETMQHDGMVSMTERPSINIASDSTLHMAPGGLHIMLIELKQTLRAHDSVHMSIELGDGRRLPITAVVRAP